MTGQLHQFDPDWTIAPAMMLQEWMKERGLDARDLAILSADSPLLWGAAEGLILDVLHRLPLTEEHARVLAHGTRIPARTWQDLERGYRQDLAAGRTDCSGD